MILAQKNLLEIKNLWRLHTALHDFYLNHLIPSVIQGSEQLCSSQLF